MEMTFAPSFVKLSQKLVFKSQKELSLRIWPYTRRQCGNGCDFVQASDVFQYKNQKKIHKEFIKDFTRVKEFI